MRIAPSHLFAMLSLGLIAMLGVAQDPPKKAVVKITDLVAGPKPAEVRRVATGNLRIRIGTTPGMHFGLMLDGARLCCGQDSSIWPSFRVDGADTQPIFGGFGVGGVMPAQPDPTKPQLIVRKQTVSGLEITQNLEPIPTKPIGLRKGDSKRSLDACLVTYSVVNKTQQTKRFELRTSIDMLININDGALYASPSTQPGKILNGVDLKGKDFPPYIHALERPSVTDPGVVATMSFRAGRGIGPNRIVCTTLGSIGAAWEVPAQQAGDSACAIYWPEKSIKPGEKVEFSWAYGAGLATSMTEESALAMLVSGSFEPGKTFTVQAAIEDPVPSQTISLALPAGIELLEGKVMQPVHVPAANAASTVSYVLWKGRVNRPGSYDISIRSSTGAVRSKRVVVEAPGG